MTYAFPQQPELRTPTRRPSPLPRFSMNLRTRSAAVWVMVIAISVTLQGWNGSSGVGLRAIAIGFDLIICDRRLNGVFRQHRTVDLNRWERELLSDLGILDLTR